MPQTLHSLRRRNPWWGYNDSLTVVPGHPAVVFRQKGASMGTHYRADSLIGAGVCFGTIMILYLLVVMLFG